MAVFVFSLTLFFGASSSVSAQVTSNHFVTTWDTTLAGTSGSNQITIPGTGSGYNYSIYWESIANPAVNGTITPIATSSYTITFPTSGQYRVAITGAFSRIYFNNGGDKLKILTVEQWGTIAWTSMVNAFYGCSNLTVPATDAPNLSGVTSLAYMFRGASSFNQSINHWDVSNITSLSYMFYGATVFNQPLNLWNTTNVTTMSNMFASATSFNQSLNLWNTTNVTTMTSMFSDASSFNQPLSAWDTSNVTGMFGMFNYAIAFNQPLNSWDVSKVTNFRDTFVHATAFNYPLDSWNTASATHMGNMFTDASSFNQNISMWNVSNVISMRRMFKGALAFNQDLSTWNISSLTSSSYCGPNDSLCEIFNNTIISTEYLDAILDSWATQAINSNLINFNFGLGAKTYTVIGAAALNTLRTTYNWTVTEQVILTYTPGLLCHSFRYKLSIRQYRLRWHGGYRGA